MPIRDVVKHRARTYANIYQKRGIIVRQPCSVCGEQKAQKHHPDYSKPFDVVWLCRKHHDEAHGRIRKPPPQRRYGPRGKSMKKLHTIKVDDDEWAAWKTSAESSGLTLSELIRRRMGVGLDTPNPFYQRLAELEPTALKKAVDGRWETDRKPCKHGLLFCKKCK